MKYTTKQYNGVTYLANADLPFVKDGQHGNIILGNEFTNSGRKERIPFSNLLKWQLTANPLKEQKKNETFRHAIHPNEDLFELNHDGIVFLGHATFYIRLGGINFITDPVFYSLPFLKRYSPLPLAIKNIRNINYALMSHGHMDHFDNGSIRQLLRNNGQIPILGPLQLSKLVKAVGGRKIQEAAWYQQYQINEGIQITYLPAQHWHRRSINDFNTVLWGSFWLRYNGLNVYFGGDSGYGNHYKEIRKVMGPADICILPVGAYLPTFMMQHAHMGPEEAVQAFHELGGKTMIPMHYGTFDLADEPIGEPFRVLTAMQSDGKINGQLILPAIGQVIDI